MRGNKKRSFDALIAATNLCDELNSSLQNMLHAKQNGDDVKNLVSKCTLLFLELKESNRSVQIEAESLKNETTKEKQKIDTLNLQLSNLLYEKEYLKREIRRCQDFCSKQKVLELVPEDVFFAKAPPELLHPDNDHQKMLNRLTFELKERQKLTERVNELKARKKALTELNSQKKKFLDGLPAKLKSISQATVPIQQFIPQHSLKHAAENSAAELLPSPLYILFYQACVYKDTFDSSIDVSITGKAEDAQAFASTLNEQRLLKEITKDININQTKLESKFVSYPLGVAVHFPLQGKGGAVNTFVVKFEYLVDANIIVVSTEGLEHAENILANLYPNDTGRKSPNPSNYSSSWQVITNNKLHARPFKWAQWLGGLDFLPEYSHSKMGRYHPIESVMKQIENRLQSWQALTMQLESLSKLTVPSIACVASFPTQPISVITSWEEVTKAEFHKGDIAEGSKGEEGELASNAPGDDQPIDDSAWESDDSRYFKAILKKGKTQLQVLIELSPEYPVRAPVFKLSLLQKEDISSFPQNVLARADPAALKWAAFPSFDNNLKNIEIEINANYNKLTPNNQPNDNLLSFQIQKLQICFDIHCETMDHGEEVKRVKSTIKPFHGRGRSYHFN